MNLSHAHMHTDKIRDELLAYGYTDVAFVDSYDHRSVRIDAISSTGVRLRLYTIEDVAAALSTGEEQS